MDKQNNLKKGLESYMKNTLHLSTYQTDLFINLLIKQIETHPKSHPSFEDIEKIYRTALYEAEYINKKKTNHTSHIGNIYKKIRELNS